LRPRLLARIHPIAAAAWSIFAVPNDPSRMGIPVVNVPGWLRLMLEAAVFGFATWAINDLSHSQSAFVYSGAAVLHYGISFERITWPLRQ
jgi:hypothetical protein